MNNQHDITPEQRAAITAAADGADGLRLRATRLAVVDSPEAEKEAADFFAAVRTKQKDLDNARTRLVKPLNDHVKMINDEFKRTAAPLVEAEATVKKGLVEWRNSQEVKAADERRRQLESQ